MGEAIRLAEGKGGQCIWIPGIKIGVYIPTNVNERCQSFEHQDILYNMQRCNYPVEIREKGYDMSGWDIYMIAKRAKATTDQGWAYEREMLIKYLEIDHDLEGETHPYHTIYDCSGQIWYDKAVLKWNDRYFVFKQRFHRDV